MDKQDFAMMRRVCDPMVDAINGMTGEEIAAAMRGFYATSETNCPWYAYGLRHALPAILATIGHGKPGYGEAWGIPEEPRP